MLVYFPQYIYLGIKKELDCVMWEQSIVPSNQKSAQMLQLFPYWTHATLDALLSNINTLILTLTWEVQLGDQ